MLREGQGEALDRETRDPRMHLGLSWTWSNASISPAGKERRLTSASLPDGIVLGVGERTGKEAPG